MMMQITKITLHVRREKKRNLVREAEGLREFADLAQSAEILI